MTLRIAVTGDDDTDAEILARTLDAVLDAAADLDLRADVRWLHASELDEELVTRVHGVVLVTDDLAPHAGLVSSVGTHRVPTLITAKPLDEEPVELRAVHLVEGSTLRRLYATTRVIEPHPARHPVAEGTPFVVAGRSAEDAPLAAELTGHPLLVVTAFAPQLASNPGRPHVLLTALVAAAAERAT